MIRKSTWLVLCLCGLLVLLFGCTKKENTVKPTGTGTVTTPTNTTTDSNPVPPQPNTNVGVPPPPDGSGSGTMTTDTSPGGAPVGDKPMTARQAMDKKVREGATMEEMDNLGVPK